MKQTVRNDFKVARIARRHGMHHALKTAQEARREHVPYDLAFALMEQETGTIRNVFGHDPTIFSGAGNVTKAKYLSYRQRRRASGNRLMQGVGPGQLTWWELQDGADRMGGAWKPRVNIKFSFRRLRLLIRQNGTFEGIKAYNGSGPAAVAYARSVTERRAKWHARFN